MTAPAPSEGGLTAATNLLRRCTTPDGFVAAAVDVDNYRRVWGRDASIMGLAGLLTGDVALVDATKASMRTLARARGPRGQIPSNVDPTTGRISYGGTAGRVDSNPWFVICCAQTWKRTEDDGFLADVLPSVDGAMDLLRAWEFNDRGLLYVPATGDWADEYVHEGYVLYDQLLHLRAQQEVAEIRRTVNGTPDTELEERASRLHDLIHENYWVELDPPEQPPANVYHEVLYERLLQLCPDRVPRYWLPYFAVSGYGYRFDAFANILASLFDVADPARQEQVDAQFDDVTDASGLVPAFDPVITPQSKDWEDLQTMFSYEFQNQPYEYHNGGRWPMLTGFRVVELARRGEVGKARSYLDGIDRANSAGAPDDPWVFPEFVQGRTHAPMGTPQMGWSAAAAVMAHLTLMGEELLL